MSFQFEHLPHFIEFGLANLMAKEYWEKGVDGNFLRVLNGKCYENLARNFSGFECKDFGLMKPTGKQMNKQISLKIFPTFILNAAGIICESIIHFSNSHTRDFFSGRSSVPISTPISNYPKFRLLIILILFYL